MSIATDKIPPSAFGPSIKRLHSINAQMKNLGNVFSKAHPTIQKAFVSLGRDFGEILGSSHKFVQLSKGGLFYIKSTISDIDDLSDEDMDKDDLQEILDKIKEIVTKLQAIVKDASKLTDDYKKFNVTAGSLKTKINEAKDALEKEMKERDELRTKILKEQKELMNAKTKAAEAEKAKEDSKNFVGKIWDSVKGAVAQVGKDIIKAGLDLAAKAAGPIMDNLNKMTRGLVPDGSGARDALKGLEDKLNKAVDDLFKLDKASEELSSEDEKKMATLEEADAKTTKMMDQATNAALALNDFQKEIEKTINSLQNFLKYDKYADAIDSSHKTISKQLDKDKLKRVRNMLKKDTEGGLLNKLKETHDHLKKDLETFESAVKSCADVYFNDVYPSFAAE